jgi:hypothetical protein
MIMEDSEHMPIDEKGLEDNLGKEVLYGDGRGFRIYRLRRNKRGLYLSEDVLDIRVDIVDGMDFIVYEKHTKKGEERASARYRVSLEARK